VTAKEKKTLRREPSRSSQTCGYQLSTNGWDSTAAYCGERKAKGLYYCREHHDWLALDGPIHMAPGNTVGR